MSHACLATHIEIMRSEWVIEILGRQSSVEWQGAMTSSVRRILKRGGAKKFQKIWEEQRSESEVVPLKFSLIFRPNLGEEPKKKGLHSNFVRFFGQI